MIIPAFARARPVAGFGEASPSPLRGGGGTDVGGSRLLVDQGRGQERNHELVVAHE